MALEDLGARRLPLLEERREHVGVGALEAAPQQHRGRRRRAGPLVEHRDAGLAPRERLIDDRHVSDHDRQEAESGAGLDHGEQARGVRHGVQVAEPEREERGAAHVGIRGEALARPRTGEAGARAPVHRGESHDQADGPQDQQRQDRQQGVVGEEAFAARARSDQLAHAAPGSPQPAEREARGAEAARHAARQEDGLERVPQDPDDQDGAGDERERSHRRAP